MENELAHYARGEVVPTRRNRAVAREARGIYDQSRLQALNADSKLAVAAHAMEGIARLDRHRKSLCSPEDEALSNMLMQIEREAVDQVREIIGGPRQKQSNPWLF